MGNYIDRSALPIKNGKVQWRNCKNIIVHFKYNDIEDDILLKDLDGLYCILIYKNEEYKLRRDSFYNCCLGSILGKEKHHYKEGEIIKKQNIKVLKVERKSYPNSKDILQFLECICLSCGETFENDCYKCEKDGCPHCGRRSVDPNNNIHTLAPWMEDMLKNKQDALCYLPTSGKKLDFCCPICGSETNQTPSTINKNHGFKCLCSDHTSYGEKLIGNILNKENISFKVEYSPEWIGKKRYDFYFIIDSKKYIIEVDSKYHDEENKKEVDIYKEREAKKHNIEVIRINGRYNVTSERFDIFKKEILNSKLKDILKINYTEEEWKELNNSSLKNKYLENLKYIKYNFNKTNKELSMELGVSVKTIKSYKKVIERRDIKL